MMVPRAKDGDEWMRLSQAMVDTGAAAIKAAEAKDPDAMFEAGAEIYAVCTQLPREVRSVHRHGCNEQERRADRCWRSPACWRSARRSPRIR